ncbi:MAG: amino acid permease, partial [Burkholderiales bacterium]|nr:amino acid permease [Burkholderiales bacterium]
MIKINQLKHVLSTRQIVMMSLGSAIGTGLFYGVGKSIQLTGPSILLSYILGGIVMYFILRALTEMSVYEPNVGSFSHYAHKYLGSWAGFFCGWNYWFMYIFVCMLELSAAAFYLQYW